MDSTGSKRYIDSVRGEGHVVKRFCYSENGLRSSDPTSEGESSSSDNKRDMAQAPAPESKAIRVEANDMERPVEARWSVDSPAIVPIKKRRFQIAKVMRSPSPPPKSPTLQSPQSVFTEKLQEVGIIPLSAISNTPLPSPLSPPPKPPSPRSLASLSSQSLQQSVSPLQTLARSPGGGGMSADVRGSDLEGGEQPSHSVSLLPFPSTDKGNSGPYSQDTVSDTKPSPPLSEGELLSSSSKDDRLHWDLNTEMTTWDEDSGGKVTSDGDEAIEHPHRSSSVNSEGRSHGCPEMGDANDPDYDKKVEEKSQRYGCHDHHHDDDNSQMEELSGEVQQEEQKIVGEVMEATVQIREEVMEEMENVEEALVEEEEEEEEMQVLNKAPVVGVQVMGHETQKHGIEDLKSIGPGISGNLANKENDYHSYDPATSQMVAQRTSDKGVSRDGYFTMDGGNGHEDFTVHDHDEGDDDLPERDFTRYDRPSKSFSDDGEGWNRTSEEPEQEEHVDYGDSDFRDADEMGMDVDDRTQEETLWEGEDGTCLDAKDRDGTCLDGTPKLEGEAKEAGEMLTLVGEPAEPGPEKRTRNRMSGWDKLPEGFDNAEEAMRAAMEVSSGRGGRGGAWSSPRGRGSMASSHSASRFGPGPTRGNARAEFFSAQAEGYYRGRHDDDVMHERDRLRHGRRLDDHYSPQSGARGRDLGRRPGMFVRERVGDWSDPFTVHANEWGDERHRPSSGFSGPLDREFFDKPGSRISPGRGVMRPPTTSAGRGSSKGGYGRIGRGPLSDMGGVHYPQRGDQASRLNAERRGFGATSGLVLGGLHERGERGGMMDPYRSGSPPRRPNLLDRPSMRPGSRMVRSRSPPPSSHHRHPLPSGRSPHSPSSRWSREEDGYGYYDMNPRRPPSRSRFPHRISPQRLSPHVLERDERLLPSSRKHSPLLKSSINFAHMKSRIDDSVEARGSGQSRSDYNTRQMGSLSKEEFRRSSPQRAGGVTAGEEGGFSRGQRDWQDERRQEPYGSSSRGRFTSGHRQHRSAQEADDDVAPRRRRQA